jgi:serine/threonine-protein kinase
MSPEQVRGEETDPRSDIYSLGVLLFKMLTGRIPFQARSHYDVMRAHVEQVPPPLRDFVPSLPNSIENAVLRALAKSPEERFATAGEFRLQLEEAHRGSTATPPEPDPKPLDWALGSDGDTKPGSAAPMITTARPEEERDGSPKTGPTLPAYERATRVLADALSCSGAEGETSPATVPTFTQGSDDPVAGSPGEEGTPRTKRPRSFPWRGVAAGTLLLALALGLFWIQIRETRPAPAAALRTTPKPPLRVTPEPHGAVARVPPQAHATPLLHDRVETPAGATDEAASTLELETSEQETEASSAVVPVVEEFEAKPSAPVLAEASAATGRSAVSPDPIATNRPPEGAPTPPAEPSRVEAAPQDAEESPPVGRGWIIRRE